MCSPTPPVGSGASSPALGVAGFCWLTVVSLRVESLTVDRVLREDDHGSLFEGCGARSPWHLLLHGLIEWKGQSARGSYVRVLVAVICHLACRLHHERVAAREHRGPDRARRAMCCQCHTAVRSAPECECSAAYRGGGQPVLATVSRTAESSNAAREWRAVGWRCERTWRRDGLRTGRRINVRRAAQHRSRLPECRRFRRR